MFAFLQGRWATSQFMAQSSSPNSRGMQCQVALQSIGATQAREEPNHGIAAGLLAPKVKGCSELKCVGGWGG